MTKKMIDGNEISVENSSTQRDKQTSHYPHHHHLLEEIATTILTWVTNQHISLYTRVMKILDDIGSSVESILEENQVTVEERQMA